MHEKMKALIEYLKRVAEVHRVAGRAGAAAEADGHADALQEYVSKEAT